MKTQENEITEAQVVSFLQAKRAELQKATGISYSCIRTDIDGTTGVVEWLAYCDGSATITSGATVAEAIAKMVAVLQPDNRFARAQELRQIAAAHLAAAEKIEEAAK